uniref:Os08g0442700 protein n=1 Tax=Macrostomum lignano TaxID=282301 RepID=A0A1I8IF53_9PLAT
FSACQQRRHYSGGSGTVVVKSGAVSGRAAGTKPTPMPAADAANSVAAARLRAGHDLQLAAAARGRPRSQPVRRGRLARGAIGYGLSGAAEQSAIDSPEPRRGRRRCGGRRRGRVAQLGDPQGLAGAPAAAVGRNLGGAAQLCGCL